MARVKHGHLIGGGRTREYKAWTDMKGRCTNPRTRIYKYYGGRGIKVCDRWQHFENFLADMGLCPPGLSIHRIDNDGDYEAENCRWATRSEQRSNQRSPKLSARNVAKIKVMAILGLPKRFIADQFKVTRSHVYHILSGKSWSQTNG